MVMNLYISNFKYPRSFLLMLGIILVLNILCMFIYSNEKNKYKSKLYEIEANYKEVNYLHLGDSKVLNGVDTEWLTKSSGYMHYNMGLSGANLATQYYFLKEILDGRSVKIDNVILYLSYIHLTDKYNPDNYVYSLRLYNNKELLEYYRETSPRYKTRIIVSKLFPLFNYKLDYKLINFNKKMKGNSYYGYSPRNGSFIKNIAIKDNRECDDLDVNKESFYYMDKIIDITNKKGIKVFITVPPIPETIYSINYNKHGYSKLSNFINKYSNNGILCSPRYMPDYYYVDWGHLNGEYAKEYTKIIGALLKGTEIYSLSNNKNIGKQVL